MRFEAVYRDDFQTAADVDGESLVASLGHQIWPLIWGRECGANSSSADVDVEGLLKRRWQLLGRLCIRQRPGWRRGCHAEILRKVKWRRFWCGQHLARKADRSSVDKFC